MRFLAVRAPLLLTLGVLLVLWPLVILLTVDDPSKSSTPPLVVLVVGVLVALAGVVGFAVRRDRSTR